MHTPAQLKKIGEMMSSWHSSMGDPIYAVGSYFYGGHEYPDVDVVRRAVVNLEHSLAGAKKRLHGWGPQDAKDLATIIAFLKKYISEKTTKAKKGSQEGLEEMLRAYMEAALWSSTDDDGEPLDRSPYTFSKAAIDSMRKDVSAFLHANAADIGTNYSQAGHDFWLTRNGHGVGFWESGRGWSKEQGKRLTEACKRFRESILYVANRRIHVG